MCVDSLVTVLARMLLDLLAVRLMLLLVQMTSLFLGPVTTAAVFPTSIIVCRWWVQLVMTLLCWVLTLLVVSLASRVTLFIRGARTVCLLSVVIRLRWLVVVVIVVVLRTMATLVIGSSVLSTRFVVGAELTVGLTVR